ncbi:MAG: type II toxin-antitoxin system VapC family toxin [Coriobacteriia bacterium]|nr:type II toxin-antitoxin system VapC family toxin [Coriobacteriia bacterium]
MKPLLLDTNVVSELRKDRARMDTKVYKWAQGNEIESCYISSITLFELEKGILLLQKKDSDQAAQLSSWLSVLKEVEFKGRILSFGTHTAQRAALLHMANPRPLLDSFIAATALEHNMIVATRNTQDFLDFGVAVMNPWDSGSPVLQKL